MCINAIEILQVASSYTKFVFDIAFLRAYYFAFILGIERQLLDGLVTVDDKNQLQRSILRTNICSPKEKMVEPLIWVIWKTLHFLAWKKWPF